MITDTVNAILEAEKQAEEITSSASEEAKVIVSQAETEAEKIRLDAVEKVKKERTKVIESAVKEGDASYAKIVLAGKKQSDKIENGTALDKAADFIKEKVLTEYVNR